MLATRPDEATLQRESKMRTHSHTSGAMSALRNRSSRALGLAAVVLLLGGPGLAAQSGGIEELRTPAEESGFTEYTSYYEMMDYLEDIRALSPDVRMGIYGETRQGRELPYLVFSRPEVTQGWEAAALDRPVVELHANVHGGERDFRESLLLLTRELATPGSEANEFLDDMVIIVSPQINPDGFQASDRGTRGNSWGLDLNRDYTRLEHPSIYDWVQNVFQEWNPHVWVDGHNGGAFPYNLKYQCPGHADPNQELTRICDEGIFPLIDERLEAEDLRSFFWSRGDEERWSGGATDARISRNYAGFVNAIGILFEAPGWQDGDDAARAGHLGYKAVLEYVRDNPDEVMQTVADARREAVELGSQVEGDVAVQMDVEPEDWTVDYLIGEEVDDEMEILEVEDAPIYKRPVATETRARPYAYILPRDAEDAVDLLRRHNITVEQLQEPVTMEVEAYELLDVSYGSIYNHRSTPILDLGSDPVTIEQEFPADTYVVPTGQMMGRVVTHLLEPETDDNLIKWGTMDRWLPLAELEQAQADGEGADEPVLVPIYKLMERAPLPARIID